MSIVRGIESATARLLATADALPDDEWTAPSICEDWSRAHVLGHVALNAEGLAGALRGLTEGVPTTMYVSNEQRDFDIAELATASPTEIRERLRSSAAAFGAALAGITAPDDARFERTPGGPLLRAGVVPLLRLREVEIHHADLAAGYAHADWPRENSVKFLDLARHGGMRPDCRVVATDGTGTWELGSPGPDALSYRGPVSALAWWASGRDAGDLVTPA
ncbi:maleylpyruvate isomerase family mycothiol-dependent enzyme [Nocardioides sp. WS12]|uniref:maleylpyruvate isomerase family mycothiol-dependent enzyme n=1 Tax=Nocardioides sp. WS12 TaxID=2486272 RepID=UPI0015FA79C4|nr:maleylpyruvate isomerase family mycothiol-dependent enzyme [Nocardioides sp. WS12]